MKKKRLSGLLIALIWLLVVSLSAMADVPSEPMSAFYVNDFADVMKTDDTERMLDLGAYIAEETGAELVAVTVNFLDGMDAEEYAYELYNKWEIGEAGENNGILILLSVGDRDIYVTRGEGLEDEISAAAAGGYIDDYAIDYLSENNYSAGMRSLYEALANKLASIYGITLPAQPYGQDTTVSTNSPGYNSQYVNEPYVEQTNSSGGFGGIMSIIIGIIVVVVIISVVSSLFRSAGGAGSGCLFGWLLGRGSRPRRYTWGRGWGAPPPPPPRGGPSAPRSRPSGGRSTGSFGGGSFGGGSRSGGSSGGSSGGGGRSRPSGRVGGGGGSSRGGGAGRKF